jgi:hypothetical protein
MIVLACATLTSFASISKINDLAFDDADVDVAKMLLLLLQILWQMQMFSRNYCRRFLLENIPR